MNTSKKFAFLVVYLLATLPYFGLYLGGWYSFFPYAILFVFVPLVDSLVIDTKNHSPEQEKQLSNERYYRYVLYPYIFIQILMIAGGVYIVSTQNLSWPEWFGFTTSVGLITGGVGINFAHEMMHKNNRLMQFLSKALLVTVCYGHFIIEHVKGHHVRVATPDDTATALLGESLYHFLPRTIVGSIKSSFRLEQNRLHRKQLSIWSIRNNFWWIIVGPLTILLACYAYGGFNALAFFLLQSLVAILTLEIVNYIEHYGLLRKKLTNGHYEKVMPCHSWNASHWLSNLLLIHLQRHSDHHTHGARPYQILRHMEQSPQLPSGYLGMLIIALFPPLWRAVMDKRVLAYKEHLNSSNVANFDKEHIQHDISCELAQDINK